jgi:glutamate-1-semialdehyde 2,1-aminomutase
MKPEPTTIAGRTVTNFTRSDAFRAASHRLIPGGSHTYSKGDDQYPELAPAAIVRGKGGRLWDVDGNAFVDCSLSLGAISLGHAYEPVLAAVRAQLELGANFQRPGVIELELAARMCAAIPGADRIKFAKNGSTVTTAAVRLARAFTGRPLVALPGNHSFYSYDDWFIGTTVCRSGVPEPTQALTLTYNSTKPDTLAELFKQHPGQIACVITEPEEVIPAPPEALREVMALAKRNGAVFVADEMVSGYRAGFPGACAKLGLEPDLITWGKGAGNGFSFCALTGRADIMDLGGIKQTERARVFLMSTTNGAETHALAAAQAVLHTYQTQPVLEHHARLVKKVAAGMRAAVVAARLEGTVEIHESSWRVVTVYRDAAGKVSLPFRTLMLQEMIGRGVLFQGLFMPCFMHTNADADAVVTAFEQSCVVYREALTSGLEQYLVGSPTRPVFRQYNGCLETCPSLPCPHEPMCRTRASR